MVGIPDWEAELRWAEFEPLIKKALYRSAGEYSSEDIRKFIGTGDMQLWANGKEDFSAVAVTQILDYPRKRIAEIILAATNKTMGVGFWREAIQTIQAWAYLHHCRVIRTHGRPGWGRVMGWKKIYDVFEVEI